MINIELSNLNLIEITDLSLPELDVYARLSEVQLLRYNEPDTGIFIAESPKVIKRALDAGYEPISFLTEKEINEETLEVLTHAQNVPIYTAPFEVLTKLTGFQLTRGMLCAMKRKPLLTIEEICKDAKRIAILENVVNPTNVGAIIRSAAAMFVDAVILTPACSDPLYRRAARVSMGCVFQVPWTYFPKTYACENKDISSSQCNPVQNPCPNLKMQADNTYIPFLQSLGFKTAAMALSDDSVSIDDAALLSEEKLAIILGTEGEGLLESTISASDYTVKIPMAGGVDSLNVAAASAVAFWQLCKK